MFAFKKHLKYTVILTLTATIGYLGLHFWMTRGWQKACGTYLVGGGETYVTITGKAGWLQAEGCVNSYWPSTEGAKKETTASFSDGVLELRQTVRIPDTLMGTSGSGKPGPDGVDDGAAVQYDSSNGSKSRGDVIRTLPRKSEYPYQKNGVRAKDAADLLRQYPNGLPVDPFADSRPLPLSILESSSTETLRVFSFGPSCAEKTWVDSVLQSSDVAHVSPPGASLLRSKQKVFLRQDATPGQAVSGHWIQPSYDPTNGTKSGGTLHLDIPKPRD